MAPRPMSAAKAERKRAGSSFVIATRNRPDFLRDAVESLVAQTVLPEELCIVDSSDEAPARKEIEELCASAGIRSTTSTRRRAASPCSAMSASTGRAATPSS